MSTNWNRLLHSTPHVSGVYCSAEVEKETVALLKGANLLRQGKSVLLQKLTRSEAVELEGKVKLVMA